VWDLSLVVYGRIDTILLSVLAHEAAVGWYSAAYRIIGIPMFIPTIVMAAIFPALSNLKSNSSAFSQIFQGGLRAVLLSTTPIAVGCLILPDKLLAFLGYGEDFTNSIPLIMILAVQVPIIGVDMILGSSLNALDKQRIWALVGVGAAVITPALNMLLIPVTQSLMNNGAIGAASSSLIVELYMMINGILLLRGLAYGRNSFIIIPQCLAANVMMGVIIWIMRDFFLPVTIILGAVVYGVMLLITGAISMRDVSIIQRTFMGRVQVYSTSSA
jgi:O-antigen/teichoic acid export membrane protein